MLTNKNRSKRKKGDQDIPERRSPLQFFARLWGGGGGCDVWNVGTPGKKKSLGLGKKKALNAAAN